jgi:hypothetical protein
MILLVMLWLLSTPECWTAEPARELSCVRALPQREPPPAPSPAPEPWEI